MEKYLKWRGDFDMSIIDKLKLKVEQKKREKPRTQIDLRGAPLLNLLLNRQLSRMEAVQKHVAKIRQRGEEMRNFNKIKGQLEELAREGDMR